MSKAKSAGGGPGSFEQSGTGREQYLFDGEDVLIDARPAWTAWMVHLVVAIVAGLGGLLADESGMQLFGILIAAAIVGYVWFQRKKVRYLVTDRRILVVTGISSRSTNEAWMVDVRGMQTGASFMERLLGHGHITVSTDILSQGSLLASRLNGMTLGGISNYEDVAAVIRKRQAQEKH
ncbi:putative membrane protein [Halovivax ruber XH-70]|uniref:Putative membrane protein n=1 Tax=Halovivax ruber (strain DSM 18193 / JCM 13892 / XH-70) TaxID=797302 RepID=L0IA84_HALRX|nr:putative membrane protein [Halovivax ruber XH-70]